VRLNYKGVVLLLADLLADSEKAARVAAAQALGGTGAVAAIPLLRFKVRAGDPEPEVISACFSALIGLDPDDSIPFVAEFLERPDEAMQEAAALALGESRQAAALAPLKSFCEQAPAGSLQEVAFLSLAMLRLPAAIDSLLEVVSQQNQDSASAAISALAIYRHNPSIRERAEAAVSRNGNDAVRKWFDKKFATKD
jgi:HEAT repeat protein